MYLDIIFINYFFSKIPHLYGTTDLRLSATLWSREHIFLKVGKFYFTFIGCWSDLNMERWIGSTDMRVSIRWLSAAIANSACVSIHNHALVQTTYSHRWLFSISAVMDSQLSWVPPFSSSATCRLDLRLP